MGSTIFKTVKHSATCFGVGLLATTYWIKKGGAATLVAPRVVMTPRLSVAVATMSKTVRLYLLSAGSISLTVYTVVLLSVTFPAHHV